MFRVSHTTGNKSNFITPSVRFDKPIYSDLKGKNLSCLSSNKIVHVRLLGQKWNNYSTWMLK